MKRITNNSIGDVQLRLISSQRRMNISSLSSLPDGYSMEEIQATRQTLKMTFAIAYFICFLFGTVGNGIVIVMTINVLSSMQKGLRRRRSISSTNHVFIYVLGLSIVDLLVILHLPFLILDLMQGQWLFGQVMCKLYWFGESVNKLLSSFIMTVLSWDRYLAVCSPVKSMKMRSNLVALVVLVLCSTLAILLLLPVVIQATQVKIDTINMVTLAPGSAEEAKADEMGVSMSKCMFESDATFVLYTFFIGFALPAIFITAFYAKVIGRLQRNSALMRRSKQKGELKPKPKQSDVAANRVKQKSRRNSIMQRLHLCSEMTFMTKIVTKRIVAVILFYYFCWTPQWTLNLLSQFNLLQVSFVTPAVTAIFFGAHLLVCFNSAVNPVLYALINRELRSQHSAAMNRKRQSISHATHVALEFVARHTHKVSTNTQRASLFSVEGKDGFLAAHFMPPITQLRHSIAGIKMNFIRKNSVSNPLPDNDRKLTVTSITHVASESVLSSIARREAETREEQLENEDAYL